MNLVEARVITKAIQSAASSAEKQIKQDFDDALIGMYEQQGVKSLDLRLGGKVVGTASVVMSKEKPEVLDRHIFEEWALENGLAQKVIKVVDKWQDLCEVIDGEVYLKATGEAVPGVCVGEPHVSHTMVRGCKPEDVIPFLKENPQLMFDAMSDQLLLGE